jgi:hypothetical protein
MSDEIVDDSVAKAIGKGTVLHWENYEFETGEKKDSLFLVLSDCEFGCFLAIRATTKTEFYEKPSTLTREFLLIPEKTEVPLPKKFVIDFAHIRSLYLVKIRKGWGKEIRRVVPVSDDLVTQIDQLVQHSKIVQKAWIKWIIKSSKQI